MSKSPDLAEILGDHNAIDWSKQPAYKRDPRRVLRVIACGHCSAPFPVMRGFPKARFCSRRCGLIATLPPDHNARVARATIAERAERLRGRGEGKAYPKLNGRHAHRVVAEQKLGRPLRPGEIAHHCDENKLNYSAENIDVLSSRAEHARLHTTGTKQSPATIRKRVETRKRTMAARREAVQQLARDIATSKAIPHDPEDA